MGKRTEVKVKCPKCKAYWADMKVRFEDVIRPGDIKVKPRYKKKAKVKLNKSLRCPKCEYVYTGIDIFAMIAKTI